MYLSDRRLEQYPDSKSGEVNYEKIEKEINSKIVTTSLKILPAKAGNYSGMIGAALLLEEKIS